MKLNTTKGKKIDTKKMSDKDAAIHEAVAKLLKVCKQYNAPLYCRAIIGKRKYCGAQFFGEKGQEDGEFMLELFNDYIERVTKGEVVLFKIKK